MSCSEDNVITTTNLAKSYHLYKRPRDRLKQLLWGRRRSFYEEFWSLWNIDLTINKGESVGIIGRNGAGKSTLLKLLSGTLTPTEGTIGVRGKVAAMLELGTGFNPEFTGRQNVYFNAAIHGLGQNEVQERFDTIAAFADIGEFIDRPVKTYSSGMVVRLAFAVMAHVDADVLILDEALAVGDVYFMQRCWRYLRQFRENGTLIFVSHDMGAVNNLCERAIWLEDGRIREDGPAKRIAEAYLESVYESIQGPSRLMTIETTEISPTETSGVEAQREFGLGGTRIVRAVLMSEEGRRVAHVRGGEAVELRITLEVHDALEHPIIGFLVKDRLGQTLFGENTVTADCVLPPMPRDSVRKIAFRFVMPQLARGTYALGVAVAEGTSMHHVQHHWIHEALLFESLSGDDVIGQIRVPMLEVRVDEQSAVT